MKILKNNIESFILSLKKQNFKGVLVYGSDIGVVCARELDIRKQFSDFETLKFDLNAGKTMRDVRNEILTPSLFGTKKFILLTGGVGEFSDIEEVLTTVSNFDGFILFTFTQNLDVKSKIRKLCEAAENIAVIACYADEDADIIEIITTYLKSKKLDIEPDAAKWITLKFKGNRGILLSELEKISLFKQSGRITLFEAQYVMDESEVGSIFDAVNHFFSFNVGDFLKEMQELSSELPASVLISNLINYNFKLIEILEEKDLYRKTIDVILTEKSIFFKQIPKMKNHLSRWNLKMLNELSKTLFLAEVEVRKNADAAYSFLTLSLCQRLKSYS